MMIRFLIIIVALLFASHANAAACIETGDVMRPICNGNNFLAGVKSIHVTLKRVRVAPASPAIASDIRMMVDAAAFSAGVPKNIAHAVIRQESNYNPRLRGRAGEWGLGQIKCQTARSVGFGGLCGALADAVTNLRYSMAYLRLALERGGQGCGGVTLYNRGLGARVSCSSYGRQVMARAGR
jgi:soluble lytic murein transglycosylase-like protein